MKAFREMVLRAWELCVNFILFIIFILTLLEYITDVERTAEKTSAFFEQERIH